MLGYDFLPIVYPMVFDEDDYIMQEPSESAKWFMYKNTVFLENANEELLTWLGLFLLYPLFKILSQSGCKIVANYSTKTIASYKYDV